MNLVAVSKVIVRAAQARENSRGAHFRADFPDPAISRRLRFTRFAAPNGVLTVESCRSNSRAFGRAITDLMPTRPADCPQ